MKRKTFKQHLYTFFTNYSLIMFSIFIFFKFIRQRHMNITTTYTNNMGEQVVVCLGQFTSNKDEGTVFVAPKQTLNKEFTSKNKEQRFRPYTQLVIVPMEKVLEYKEATAYCKIVNQDEINIKANLINALNNYEKTLRENPLREYHNFTRDNLQEIAEKFTKAQIEHNQALLSKMESKFNDLPDDKLLEVQKRKENQLKKEEKQTYTNKILKGLSPEYRKNRADVEKQIKNAKSK